MKLIVESSEESELFLLHVRISLLSRRESSTRRRSTDSSYSQSGFSFGKRDSKVVAGVEPSVGLLCQYFK